MWSSDEEEVIKPSLPYLGPDSAAQLTALADVTLVCKNGELPAHQAFLTRGSKVCFRAAIRYFLVPKNRQYQPRLVDHCSSVSSAGPTFLPAAS